MANVLVALTVVGVAGAYGYVQWRFGQIKTKTIPTLTGTDTSNGKPFTLLIVGSDSRAAIAAGGDNTQFGGASQVGGQRSDTIILVRVVPSTRQLMMLSIPRDLWGPIPGHGSNRINSAFDTGASLLVQTITQDLGIPVDHYAEINFDTFRDISNAVGGVKFYFPTPARDPYSLLNIPTPGCYTLVGDQALAFVRSRHYQYKLDGYWHSEGLSDLARIQRQQAFIKKMIKKAESEFTNPIALNNVIGGVTKNLTVDSKFSTSLMLDLAKDFRTMNTSAIPNITLPTYSYVTAGGADVLGLQQPQAKEAIAAFNAFGTTPPPAGKPSSSAPASKTPKINMPSVTVAPSSVNIEVANGTGVGGQAGQMSQWLSGLGYYTKVDSASPGYNHSTTEIHYAPDSLTAAQQVGAKMPGGATLVEDSSLTPTPYNLEVITGSSYTAASGTGGQSSSSAGSTAGSTGGSTTTATTVPGTNSSVYELPGASGPPPANC
ncbi:MAG TPA: LCP family protein [Acidimicrobiales bacterium]|nr:LCP family protein [Acidimicrobiales bacterium]